jgi:hypothetical protein
MRHSVIILIAACIVTVALTGCQKSESESNQIRRARVVATENLQLKKQLDEKEAQIEALKAEMDKSLAESAREIEAAGDANLKVLKLLLESEQANEALRLEVEQLHTEIEKLKTE